MSVPGAEVDPACWCRVDLGEVCPRCSLSIVGPHVVSVPTATVPRPSPGSPAAELAELRAFRSAIRDALGLPHATTDATIIAAAWAAKPAAVSPMLDHVLALLELESEGNEAMPHLMALLRLAVRS